MVTITIRVRVSPIFWLNVSKTPQETVVIGKDITVLDLSKSSFNYVYTASVWLSGSVYTKTWNPGDENNP